MKTFDEVIKALELCTEDSTHCHNDCPYFHEDCVNHGIEEDALHYLKEYRNSSKDLVNAFRHYTEEVKKYEQAQKDLNLNDPLTWDELNQMEGKPVWIELLKGKWKGWDVIGGFYEDDFGFAMCTVRGDDYYLADLGKTWQAYRKERE